MKNMPTTFRIVFLLGLISHCFGQKNFLGLYYLPTGLSSYSIELKPNNICIINYPSNCGGQGLPADTTTWRQSLDTVHITQKNKDILSETFVYKDSSLFEIAYSDSILSKKIINRISDHYYLNLEGFRRIKGYYQDGCIYWEIQEFQNKKLIFYYFPNGKIKELQQYSKIETKYASKYIPSGDWYEFHQDGFITKHNSYKKGKLEEKSDD